MKALRRLTPTSSSPPLVRLESRDVFTFSLSHTLIYSLRPSCAKNLSPLNTHTRTSNEIHRNPTPLFYSSTFQFLRSRYIPYHPPTSKLIHFRRQSSASTLAHESCCRRATLLHHFLFSHFFFIFLILIFVPFFFWLFIFSRPFFFLFFTACTHGLYFAMNYGRTESPMHASPPASAPATASTDLKPTVKTNTPVTRPTATSASIPLSLEQPASDTPNFPSGNPANVEHPSNGAIPSTNMIATTSTASPKTPILPTVPLSNNTTSPASAADAQPPKIHYTNEVSCAIMHGFFFACVVDSVHHSILPAYAIIMSNVNMAHMIHTVPKRLYSTKVF